MHVTVSTGFTPSAWGSHIMRCWGAPHFLNVRAAAAARLVDHERWQRARYGSRSGGAPRVPGRWRWLFDLQEQTLAATRTCHPLGFSGPTVRMFKQSANNQNQELFHGNAIFLSCAPFFRNGNYSCLRGVIWRILLATGVIP
jgi:hypothetical protein